MASPPAALRSAPTNCAAGKRAQRFLAARSGPVIRLEANDVRRFHRVRTDVATSDPLRAADASAQRRTKREYERSALSRRTPFDQAQGVPSNVEGRRGPREGSIVAAARAPMR